MTETTIPDDIHRKRRFWQAHIKAFTQSGFSRSEYCRRNNLSYHAMTYWLRRRQQTTSNALSSLNLVRLPATPSGSHHHGGGGLVLRVGAQYSVELQHDFSQDMLARLLSVLEAR